MQGPAHRKVCGVFAFLPPLSFTVRYHRADSGVPALRAS